jgi:hypothetical protein
MGSRIDPKRIEAIETINIPRNVKEIQSFLGTINFLRRFIPNFAEIVKLIIGMLKKDSRVNWMTEAKASFVHIKKFISEAPVLASPDYLKDFLIFSFSSEHTIMWCSCKRMTKASNDRSHFLARALETPN